MKKLLGLILTMLLLIVNLSSCSRPINFIEVEPLCLSELGGKTYFLSDYTNVNYKLDLVNNTITRAENEDLPTFEEAKPENAFKYEQFHGEYGSDADEALAQHLMPFELTENDSLVYAFGYWQEEILVGAVQVYDGYARSCSGYDLANLDHSVLFTYNSITDTFTVTREFIGAAVVAFAQETVIYWKNRAYYAYDLMSETEVYLTDDKAFDSGITNYATPYVYFNGEMCIFYLIKDFSRENVFFYAYSFETNDFVELKWQK